MHPLCRVHVTCLSPDYMNFTEQRWTKMMNSGVTILTNSIAESRVNADDLPPSPGAVSLRFGHPPVLPCCVSFARNHQLLNIALTKETDRLKPRHLTDQEPLFVHTTDTPARTI